MMSYEDFEKLINGVKDKLGSENSALVSEELLSVISNTKTAYDNLDTANEEIKTLKSEKDDLLKVNGRLFQKIGFDKTEEEENLLPNNQTEEKPLISDVINEKGDFI